MRLVRARRGLTVLVHLVVSAIEHLYFCFDRSGSTAEAQRKDLPP
jgi:hypothetical protein